MPVATGRITHQSVIRCLGASATVIIGFDTEYEIKTDEDVELPDQHPGNHVLCYTFTVAELLGFSKIELPPGAIEHMSKLMHDDPALFEAYAVRDAEVAAAWLIAMLRFFEVELGINPGRQPPATLGAAAVKKFKALCKDEDYPLDDLLGFERIETIVNGRRRSVRQKMAPYRDRESFFADCYHGGRNEAYYAGFTPEGVITDLDICGAYTTAMAAIRTPDWRKAADTTEIDILTEAGERGMAVARVRFRFPAGTRFPCLPIRAGDAGLIYPLSGVSYATGPELVVARRLGAIIEVERGVFVPWLDERRPFSLVTEVVNDIRKRHTKGTAFERAGKEIGNSLYGKLGQGIDLLKSPEGAGKAHVRGKRVFDSRKGEMTTLPPSSISSAALAAFTTGLVRAYLSELLAAVPPEKAVYTATTDGLLTEATLTDLQDTGPLSAMFVKLRWLVAGNPIVLEVKGVIAQGLIVKTRGTFTAKPLGDKLDGNPIMARAGFRLEDTPKVEPKDATPEASAAARRAEAWAENDQWLEIYRARKYELIHRHKARIDLRTQWLNDSDLVDVERSTRVNLDPDLKRKPVGIHERKGVLAFDTVPWGSLEDFIQARDDLEQWKRCEKRVLRTLDDWHAYRAWAEARPAKMAANTRGGRPAFITAAVRAWIHSQLGLPGPAGRGKTGGERIADLARDMTAGGWPVTRAAIDNARRQEARLAAFTALTEADRDFLRWALDRWPDADLTPLAVSGSSAAKVIALEQKEARERRAEGISVAPPGHSPEGSNASERIPPYSRKDALRTVPGGGAAASDNPLGNFHKSNASYQQLKPTTDLPVRTMGTVRRRGNGAAPICGADQERLEADKTPSKKRVLTDLRSPLKS